MSDSLEAHYNQIIRAIKQGRIVFFLGAGVNLCGRSADKGWCPGETDCLPSGGELAAYLANVYDYPSDEPTDLARISQHIAVMDGTGPLYTDLHTLFDVDYPMTLLHKFLAGLPSILRDKNYPHPYQLIVTTNYDDVLERAFRDADEPFDLICYIAEGENRGKFLHQLSDGEAILIKIPNEYLGLSLDQRPVILKIHGTVNRAATAEDDSFVITEDHYIDYLTRADSANFIPMKLVGKMKNSNILFMGYSLRDWNLRVILHRIWRERKLTFSSWAIQRDPSEVDRRFWLKRNVEILYLPLDKYIATLTDHLENLPPLEVYHERGT